MRWYQPVRGAHIPDDLREQIIADIRAGGKSVGAIAWENAVSKKTVALLKANGGRPRLKTGPKPRPKASP
jgi:hypothetical protein